jgi:hypothetical protein
MKAVDPTIQIGVNGNNEAWFKDVLERAAPYIDFLAVHVYALWPLTSYQDYLQRGLNAQQLGMIAMAARAIQIYAPQYADHIKVAVTETGAETFQSAWNDNDLGHGIATIEALGWLVSNPQILYTQFWVTRWIENESVPLKASDALEPHNTLSAVGKALKVIGTSLLTQVVFSTHTPTVKSFAFYDPGTRQLHLVLLNKGSSARDISVILQNYDAVSSGQRCQYSGTGPDDREPTVVCSGSVSINNGAIALTLPAISATIIRLSATI